MAHAMRMESARRELLDLYAPQRIGSADVQQELMRALLAGAGSAGRAAMSAAAQRQAYASEMMMDEAQLEPIYDSLREYRRSPAPQFSFDAFAVNRNATPIYHHQQHAPHAQDRFYEPSPTPPSAIDYEFVKRRRAALLVMPGSAAKQVLSSPVDVWGLQTALLHIRAAAGATDVDGVGHDDAGDLFPWQTVTPRSTDFSARPASSASPAISLSNTTALNTPDTDASLPLHKYIHEHRVPVHGVNLTGTPRNRLSFPSSDESAALDFFSGGEGDDVPLTPTTTAYSDSSASRSCIIRISGAHKTRGEVALLAAQIAALVGRSTTVQRAAFTPCEPLDAHTMDLGQFVPSDGDISVKLLFAGPGDNFANASAIFQPLGGCILVKPVAEYALEADDEAIREPGRARSRSRSRTHAHAHAPPVGARPPRMRAADDDGAPGFGRLVRKLQRRQDAALALAAYAGAEEMLAPWSRGERECAQQQPRYRTPVEDGFGAARARAQWAQATKPGARDRELARLMVAPRML